MKYTSNLKESLVAAVKRDGESIIGIVVGKHDNARWDQEAAENENVQIPVEEGLALLDEYYDSGYGGADCRPFWAWTENKVYFVGEYDGATGLSWVPRNPADIEPKFSGV